eukprot:TRINITY_DN11472_c0_g1_i1.p1 TRINITY_DN11472_c0_g1~~TRINITY_DN11472_c0_g1_i1.p1  ORF type:complete len:305 (-),score=27.61 TRINITY_DN11472_c0_g1_i1:22-936(-)
MDTPTNTPQNYESDNVLLEPFQYILNTPGKEVRTRLIQAFNSWFNVPPAILKDITEIVQTLHISSLLIDDIEDNSKLRRGVPVAHSMYGIPWTINSANYAYFLALDKCNSLGNTAATKAFLEEMISLHRGQGFDIYWRDRNICPTEDDYRRMVLDKTGGLFRLAVRLMQSFTENSTDYVELVNLLGFYFQIRDDYLNICTSHYEAHKGFCEDLSEGKFSFPLIHAIRSNPSDHLILNVLKQRTEDVEIKKFVVNYLRRAGSFEYTANRMGEIEKKLQLIVAELGGNSLLEQIIGDLSIEKIDKS